MFLIAGLDIHFRGVPGKVDFDPDDQVRLSIENEDSSYLNGKRFFCQENYRVDTDKGVMYVVLYSFLNISPAN